MYFPAAKLGGLNFYDSFQGWFASFPQEGIGGQMPISPDLVLGACTTSRFHLLVSIWSICSINKMLNKEKKRLFLFFFLSNFI